MKASTATLAIGMVGVPLVVALFWWVGGERGLAVVATLYGWGQVAGIAVHKRRDERFRATIKRRIEETAKAAAYEEEEEGTAK